ncbi:MAG: LacI family DNA-binding transcriptional regulator [Steroidobacteraceae bacterium]
MARSAQTAAGHPPQANSSTVTLDMVAHEAGVSPSTVSRILNKTARVRDSKVRAVEAAIAKLQFLPDPVARALARGKSMTIGVVTQALDSPFYGEALLAIEHGLVRSHYSPLFVSGHRREPDERKCVTDLLARRVQGIILLNSCLAAAELVRLSRSVPLVLTGRHVVAEGIFCLDTDHTDAARVATEYLIGQGHRRIVFIAGPATHPDALQRLEGYKMALASARISFNKRLVVAGDYMSAGGYAATLKLLDSKLAFSAIFAANDQTAFGALLALYRRGLRVPRDVSLIGFDDLPGAAFSIPPLTSVHRSINEVGGCAAEAMIDMIAGRAPQATVPAPTLAIRESTRLLRE